MLVINPSIVISSNDSDDEGRYTDNDDDERPRKRRRVRRAATSPSDDVKASDEMKRPSLQSLIPVGMVPCAEPPAELSAGLLGRHIMMLWSTGWHLHIISLHFSRPRTKFKYNYEIASVSDPQEKHDTRLSVDRYLSGDADVDAAPVGSWLLLAMAPSPSSSAP